MLLLLKEKDRLSAAREALTGLGIEYSVHTVDQGVTIELRDESTPLHPEEIEASLASFGRVVRSVSKTPCLDQIRDGHRVVVEGAGFSVEFGGGSPVWVAGPCAIESRESLEDIAASLSSLGVRVLRGGATKPRTSPHDFQGVGPEGFRVIADVARRFGMLSVSEALSEDDVEEALEYLDIIQVGARNMQNFALLKKLGKGRRPVILKRGHGCTLREWALAAEYILAGGNDRLILCERGVRGLEREMRYTLDLAGAAFMQMRYRLPVVVDPSHGTGSRFLLDACTAGTLAMGMAGVMLEVHPRPVEARSDALQALTLREFRAIKERLDPGSSVRKHAKLQVLSEPLQI